MAQDKRSLSETLGCSAGDEEAAALVRFAGRVLPGWYREHARALPWRQNPTPYRVWISEVMLQQTRVEAVKPYYQRFLEALPDVPSLAEAGEDQLLKLWEGLGYYSRARNLQKAACQMMERYGGELPPFYEALLGLAGFGEYTAGAVASIAFGIRVPAVDGNVLRVFSRVLAAEGDILSPAVRRGYRELLLAAMPESDPGGFNQAVMELGATVCAPNGQPGCGSCPLRQVCRAFENGTPCAYPVKAPKKPRRIEERTVFLLVSPDGVLLRRRPDGLLAGMWEFPGTEGILAPEERDAFLKEKGIRPEKIFPLRPAKHIFTHVEWRMAGWLVCCGGFAPKEGETFVRAEELEQAYPLPSAFSAFRKAFLKYSKGWNQNG